jgi:hypothetical protein
MKRTVKISICVICASFFAAQVMAQTPSFAKGDNVVGIGVGIGGNLYSGIGYGTGIKRIPAISIFYENCIRDNLWNDKSSLGIGGSLGYAQANYDIMDGGWKSTNFIVGVRGALHYAFVDKLDTYTSLMLGYNVVSWKWKMEVSASGASASGFTMYWNVGARYYFTGTFAAFAELGYGFAIINLGVALKF